MSWSFDFVAENADAVAATLAKDTQVPPAFRDALVAAAAGTAIAADGQVLRIKSAGHIGASGGNATLEVSYLPFVKAPPVPAPAPPPDPPAPQEPAV